MSRQYAFLRIDAARRFRLDGRDVNSETPLMAHHGKIQIMMLIVAPPDQVAEGDRLFASHGAFMEATHYRSGEKALLSYNVSKAPELSDPVDMNSAPTGNTCFVLNEIYEGKAGFVDHMEQSFKNWEDVDAMLKWMKTCKAVFVPMGSIFNSLW
jgi:hypothetical protein